MPTYMHALRAWVKSDNAVGQSIALVHEHEQMEEVLEIHLNEVLYLDLLYTIHATY
jgi:hypothetical protein